MELQTVEPRSQIVRQLQPNQKLLAVSKRQSVKEIRKLWELGQRDFGENYLQEALEKIDALSDQTINWHLIGPLQKNKVKFLKKNFSYIHSVDSLELATLISKKALTLNHQQKVFLQINISQEISKSGFSQNLFIEQWPLLKKLSGLNIIGLMTMPPLENEPEKNRIYFKSLVKLGKQFDLSEFSMGTSHDYLVALEEGATWIRIGTFLFGDRNNKNI